MKRFILVIFIFGILLTGGWLVFGDKLLTTAIQRQVEKNLRGDVLANLDDGLHLILCGAGAPLLDPSRAGPCVLVLAGTHLYVIDIGSGAARNFGPMGIPSGRIDALLLTHFHSDHIDGLGELMTTRWAGGAHESPLPVYGPPGVTRVVNGFNSAYAQDFRYRIAHHGETVVPTSGAGGQPRAFRMPGPGESVEVLSADGLTITAFAVDHEPVRPAVGYRFDYRDRSLVISGDTAPSENLELFARDADLLAHEALSPELLAIVRQAAEQVGADHIRKIMVDVLDYHTAPVEAAGIAQRAGVGHLLFYHLVPPLPARPLEKMFVDGVDEVYQNEFTVGRDGSFISLPAKSDEIKVRDLL